MPTVLQKVQTLTGVKAVHIRPLDTDGTTPLVYDALKLFGLRDIPIQYLIEQGERVVDKSDGVGVIAVHEEDDTLLGVDLDLAGLKLDLYALQLMIGGAYDVNGQNEIVNWVPPTITQQRNSPKRFELTIYVETADGFLRHRLFYCRATPKTSSYLMGGLHAVSVKARENPTSQQLYALEYVDQIPTI